MMRGMVAAMRSKAKFLGAYWRWAEQADVLSPTTKDGPVVWEHMLAETVVGPCHGQDAAEGGDEGYDSGLVDDIAFDDE